MVERRAVEVVRTSNRRYIVVLKTSPISQAPDEQVIAELTFSDGEEAKYVAWDLAEENGLASIVIPVELL